MSILQTIDHPGRLRDLDAEQLETLAAEIREFLIDTVTRTGGHLGPNLGVVELTLALHRVFDSPRDRIIWDTGHQAYVHKLLTGRRDGFARLRKSGGLSGYPSQAESEHDLVENSHASTALSYADGLAKAYELTGRRDHIVVVVGDGALTGGMAWEALNNIAAADRPLVIVVNDNGRSYAPTIGGFAQHLASLRLASGYERALAAVKRTVPKVPGIGPIAYEAMHGLKKGLKDFVTPQAMFEDLGLKYVGPVDGHDMRAVEKALGSAKSFRGPVIVHCVTRKGRGYEPAENDELDHFHAVRAKPSPAAAARPRRPSWTSVFAEELVAVAEERPEVVAVTAAMLEPTGLLTMKQRFPDRVFDVGIAEQHAVTSAAGLAMGGLHPVVAIYATFLNRAFDQVLMDVALHGCPVTFVLDRAGVTGDDGPSHNGMWDLSILQVIPGLRVCAPRDAATLRAALRESVTLSDGPRLIRFPKGEVAPDVPPVEIVDGLHVLKTASSPDVLIVSVGAMAPVCLEVADRLADQRIGATVVDPVWVQPVDPALARLAGRHRLVVTVEDNSRAGGVGSAVAQALRDAEVATPVLDFGLPRRFLAHGSRAEVLAECGLTAQDVFLAVADRFAMLRERREAPVAGQPISRS